MTTLELPALRSDDPLGFLAALGILEVLRSEVGAPDDDLALAWEGVGGPAKLTSPFDTLGDLASALHAAAMQIMSEGRVLAAAPLDFPPERLPKTARDALKATARSAARGRGRPQNVPLDPLQGIARSDAIDRYRKVHGHHELRWLCGFLDQLSTLPQRSFASVTPLLALSRQQTSRQVCSTLLRETTASVSRLEDALGGWRRIEGQAGANLDWRAVRDGVFRTDGQSRPAAVPGVEWLALQSAPWFRLGGRRGRPVAWGWLPRDPGGGGRRLRTLFWPVWDRALDLFAVEVLISHPAVRAAAEGANRTEELRRLGVLAVLTSTRRREPNSDGPLGPARVMWPREGSAGR